MVNYLKATLVSMSLLTASALTAAPKLPVVEILGQKYYVYNIKKGDSVYGVAHEYGWDTDVLSKLNGNTIRNMTKGMKLFYPVVSGETQVVDVNIPAVDLSKIESQPISHVVKRGETVYSIAMMYGMSVDKLYELYPPAKSGLNPGDVVSLTQAEIAAEPTEGSTTFYTVRDGDSLHELAKTYGTTVESIMKLNPGISQYNFTSGATLKIPTDRRGTKMTTDTIREPQLVGFKNYKVENGDTWDKISRKTGVAKDELIRANRDSRSPKKNTTISIPVIDSVAVEKVTLYSDPREQSAIGLNELYDEVNKVVSPDSVMDVRLVLLMSDPASRRDLDVARGMLTAVDKLKRQNFKTTFKVIDGSADSTPVIEELDSFDPTIVFYTAENSLPSWLTAYAEVSQTPVVNLFDTKGDYFTNNPYIIHFLTPSAYFNESVGKSILDKFGGRTLLLVGDDEEDDAIAELLRGAMTDYPILSLTAEEFKDYPFEDGARYLVYGNTNKQNDINDILDYVIESRQEAPLAEIALVGRPSWIVYEDKLKEKYQNTYLVIPSRFYLDLTAQETKNFISDYKALFDFSPVRSYPLYAGVGYDMVNYFAPGLAANRGDINKLGSYLTPLQSDIELKRPSNWSGFYNPDCYLLEYSPFSSVEKIRVK